MKILIKLLFVTLALSGLTTNAAQTISSGKAVSLCRAEAMTVNNDFVRSKATRIKETRTGFSIKLKVYLAEKSIVSECGIQRDGTLSYSQTE